jgi:hypothetical protein
MTATLSYSNDANKHSTFWCGNRLVLAILFFASVVGCAPKPTLTQTVYPTSMAPCFPQSVFTADDMRARVDCHPDDYKTKINKDTVVLFAFPDPVIDWVGPIFIIHIPSVSDVVVNTDGSIFYEVYNSSEGKDAIQSVLNNQELMTSILERAKEIESRSHP